ncbi:MAG: hypothetical protein OXI57_06945 [Rhodospirillales bacterium]|nr:hypothetical protein [Rhodospirillales bacterium]
MACRALQPRAGAAIPRHDGTNTKALKAEGLHVVRPRAAGLDMHKMEITTTVR